MNSSGELFAMNEASRDVLVQMAQGEEIRMADELEQKEREALMQIPPEVIQSVASMNRQERRNFYRKAMRKRGRGYTR